MAGEMVIGVTPRGTVMPRHACCCEPDGAAGRYMGVELAGCGRCTTVTPGGSACTDGVARAGP